MSKIKSEDRNEIINILESKGITPEDGVALLIGVIFSILKANGYSPMEMCRSVNNILMTIREEPENIQ